MPPEVTSTDLAYPSFAEVSSARIVLLADDLTGACDAGAAFLRTGRTVRVWFSSCVEFSAPESVQAFTTNSRALSPGRAAHVVERAAAALGSDPDSFLFKKVDSVCRGSISAEILAAHRALGTRAVLFAPAFPSAGRTVRNGVLEIGDSTSQTRQIQLNDLFPLTVRHRIGLVSRPSELAPMLHSGKTILICDSKTQADLEALVHIAQHLPGLLYAGSAGLSQALAGLNPGRQLPAVIPTVERTLLISGSPHPLTKLQLKTFDRQRFPGVRVNRIGARVNTSVSSFAASTRIRSAFRSHRPHALILTGGETALFTVHALEAHSFILQGEISSGIPWGLVQGGIAHGCVIVTKSGGFGEPDVFNEILAALQGAE